ncbi:ABC transporter substrate-binding protein [Marinomonas algarum]|uniref:MetQ/NlpA family ABC transporter substrate-binding protein n=1 Tax=Marinomonas algarum TaxID=2883105 RepID=A0A9X1IL21_9GAMM|nr:ABC transporter substrate-binding protein [Marinomonas algarum]MCB5160877.1 MetQ/NlpA family ABC transporter substrate-binding protein [Marinomonas algarum]
MQRLCVRSVIIVWMFLAVSSAYAEEKLTLMLDWFVNPDHGALIVAQQKGLFAEQGLDVRIQEPTDPSMPAKLVAAGNIDLAVSYQPQLIQDVAIGLPLMRISTLIGTPLNTLMVLDSSEIKRIADLKGKTIGTSIADGVSEATVEAMLKKSGLSIHDVNIINMGWGLSSALASKKVDAIYGGYRNFELHQLAIEGFKGRAFYVEEEGVPPYDELVVVAKKGHVSPETLGKFNRAVELATQYIVNHQETAWDIFKSYKGDLDTELNRLAWKDTVVRFALRPAAVDVQRYEEYAAFLKQTGLIKNVPESQDYLW